jgi:CubicO group peptidase (beta-lactamase class C family)
VTGRGLPRSAAAALGTALAVLAAACSGSTAEAGRSPASAGRPPPSTAVDARSAASDDLLDSVLAEDEPGCSAAVGVWGEVVWAGARGVADVGTGAALDEETTFHVGAVAKQFTAAAVLLLVLDGRLSLDDPVARWVPGLPAWGGEVTLRHLVQHTSGVPDFIEPLEAAGFAQDERVTQQDTLTLIAGQELRFPPGQQGEYSNSGYVLLAEVVRAASGRALPDFLRDRLFWPLQLDMVLDASPTAPDETDESTARGHVRDDTGRGWLPTGTRWEMVGPAFLQTTPSELVRWGDNYRTGHVGGQSLLDAQVADPIEVRPGLDYAAGIYVGGGGELGHDGEWAGQVADFSVSPDRRTAVAVACNYFAGSTADLDHIANNLRSQWWG